MLKKEEAAAVLPEELYNKLTLALYQLYQWGVPVGEAIIVGKIIVDNYWRERNADKGGGLYLTA